jgi:hypothetical protein
MNFRYRIDSLRVDGQQSADPRDYADYPPQTPVGAELHAFVTAELRKGIAPSEMRAGKGNLVRWPLPEGLLLMLAPTVSDLRRWSRVRFVVPTCGGGYRPVEP